MRALAILILLCGVAAAQPDDRARAAALFQRGESAQAEGRYRDAIADFEEAYALLPHPNALFNIAVSYERLGEDARAADYYQRYLDDQRDRPADADAVTAKIRELRAKQPAPRVPVMPPKPEQGPPPTVRPVTTTTAGNEGFPAPDSRRRYSLGAAYGLGIADAPTQRLFATGALQLVSHLDGGVVLGLFGKNDLAAGGVLRYAFAADRPIAPFVRATGTFGYAKQDDSSSAERRLTMGGEAAAGLQFAQRGYRLDLAFAVRLLGNGFTAEDTTVDSYVNDRIEIAIDLGVALELPIIAGVR
jgi:tetratricopeptide (TPR) repeat protein